MRHTRVPTLLYVLVATASAFALPQAVELNPLIESLYFALALALVMLAARFFGLQPGIQSAIGATLISNLGFGRGESASTGAAQFGVFMLAALVISVRREAWDEARRRFRAARARRTSRAAWYERVFADLSAAIVVVDAQGRCIDANPAMAELTGYAMDELRGLAVSELVASNQRWSQDERRAFEQQGHWRGQLLLRRKDGQHASVEVRLLALELASGTVYLTTVSLSRNGQHPVDCVEKREGPPASR